MNYFKTSVASLVVVSSLFGGAFLAHASNAPIATPTIKAPVVVIDTTSTAVATPVADTTITTATADTATINQTPDLSTQIVILKVKEADPSTGFFSRIFIHFEIQKLQNELNIQNALIQNQ